MKTMATPLTPHYLDPNIHISLTNDPPDLTSTASQVRSVVLFVGTDLPSLHFNPIYLTHASI